MGIASMTRRVVAILVLTTPLALTACVPCGCTDSDIQQTLLPLLPDGVTSAKFHFEDHLFGEDRFTLEIRFRTSPPPPFTNPLVVRGSYQKSGDTITFRPEGGITALIVGGAKYTLTCQKNPKRLTIQRIGGPAFTFDCQ